MKAINFEERLRLHAGSFVPVVRVGDKASLLPLDFTAANTELTDEILGNTARFSAYVEEKLQAAGADFGIGGYGEHRTIYSRSTVFDDGQEPRRFHLGTDIWGPEGTDIYAPCAGTVHSFNFNEAYGDYGATLIFEHQLEGFRFYTLYGHLSLHSIQEKKEGQEVERGEWIAAFGKPEENGQWPPHLHFQLILDMEGKKGDYPGVCRFSERERYLANCPNPALILGF